MSKGIFPHLNLIDCRNTEMESRLAATQLVKEEAFRCMPGFGHRSHAFQNPSWPVVTASGSERRALQSDEPYFIPCPDQM